ncbi:S8 family peptidase [Risungbinella massiliensis]|uniref:S8 family peptidase n=1 Tax=Risungbinella massiliensis TaxID=1329796 RepID=UPI00069B5FCE|nr:S8 family peptidase [Risungbinella massiliensis]
MPEWKTPRRYTWIYRSPYTVQEMRQKGIIPAYQSNIFPMYSLLIPNERVMKQIILDPRTIFLERDMFFSLPQYSIVRMRESEKGYRKKRKIDLKEKQIVPWNIRRIMRDVPFNKGQGVRVGVIDTGIDLHHPDLAANIKGGINILSPSESPQDQNGHGTHIAGVIGAIHNGMGVVGIAPRVSLYAIKILDHLGVGSLGNLIQGIEWGVLHRMHILNISMCGGQNIPKSLSYIVGHALRQGTIIVAASGNSGNPAGDKDTVQVPARVESAISVAAVGKSNRRLPFSATGEKVDIAAPGGGILSTYLGNSYATLNGTSMATAHVSGVLAIYRQLFPHKSAIELKQLVLKRAIDLPPTGKDRWTGAGLVRI